MASYLEYFQYTVALLINAFLLAFEVRTHTILYSTQSMRARVMHLMNIFMRDRHNNIHTYIHTYNYTEISIDQTNTRSAQAPLE